MKTKHTKNIDITPDDFRLLSLQAANVGKKLKPYLEDKISELAKQQKITVKG